MEFLVGYSNFGAEAHLITVGEPCRGINRNRGAIRECNESVNFCPGIGYYRFGPLGSAFARYWAEMNSNSRSKLDGATSSIIEIASLVIGSIALLESACVWSKRITGTEITQNFPAFSTLALYVVLIILSATSLPTPTPILS